MSIVLLCYQLVLEYLTPKH